ncbi:MAG: glycosyltransferase family 4 protein [Pseudomonadota bacterium]
MPELIVTNFNRNYTGVSATAAAVLRQQVEQFDVALAGHPLPGAPDPITQKEALRLSRAAPEGKPFTIWHVRRNPEMRVAIWARDVLRLPIRIVFTSAAIRRHSAYPRWLISRMDAVIATTQEAAAFVPHVKAVIPHGVETERFAPAPDRNAAWAATGYPGAKGIATIGRIRPEKGTDRFVKAMLDVLPKHPDTTALVIGRAAKEHQGFLNHLKKKVTNAHLENRILFPGEIAPGDLPDLLRALSLVVQLPRYEGYGMTPLEGMASGVPFVATDQGYYRAFSSQGQAGVITSDAAQDIDALLSDPERLSKMARHARESALHHFSIEREAAEIASVYQKLWSTASSPSSAG